MSTKIYFAYRCPIKNLSTVFLPAFRAVCFKAAAKQTGSLMEGDDRPKAVIKVFNASIEASKQPYRDLDLCFDISLNVWLYNNKAYIFPVGEHWLFENFKIPDGAEDYAYWNNTDKPSNISHQQWKAREKMWKKVCLKDYNSTRLNHKIIDAKEHVGFYQIAKLILSEEETQIVMFKVKRTTFN